MDSGPRLRWAAMSVIALSGALNYLDRQLLPALAPELRAELGLTNADYGLLLAAFSIAYAASAPLAGLFVDRAGLTRGVCLLVALWSAAGAGTGLAAGFAGVLVLRAVLGVAQAGGVPATAKATALYLPPGERALGTAATQIGLSLGAIAAPLAAAWLSPHFGWRPAFLVTGVAGFLWIPLWLAAARQVPPPPPASPPGAPAGAAGLLRDHRLWRLAGANVLYMALYSLWSNWTTVFLVEERGLPPEAANLTLAWVPPVFANLGGLFGGWLALRWIGGGADVLAARRRVCRWSAAALLATAAVPFTSSAGTATALISWSFFWVTAMSVNVYAMPLDLFGAGRAAFAVSALTCAYGAMQTVFSPGAGALIDRHGFGPVCLGGALLPLGAAVLLHWRETRAPLPGGRGVTGAEERESPLADRARRPFTVRDARREDLPAIARIQGASPEAAQWDPAGYLAYECRVAERNGEVGGFIVVRPVAPGESEILNLAVAPALRRTGIAETLARDAIAERPGNLFLEVRESNHAARALYRKLGFAECGRRGEYYADPPDAAIVMRFQPC